MSKKFFILCQYLLPQMLLTRFAGWMASLTCPRIKNWLIKDFVKRYQVDLKSAVNEKIEDYVCFNDFFTRALKPTARPICSDLASLVSPIDGCISQIGYIEKNTLLQAKGVDYTLESLLGNDSALATEFFQGAFATFYLSPKDYHRVHLPFAGKLLRTIYIPGKLFSVNPLAVSKIPQLFARNERLVCIFETHLGPMAVIFIGAMLVGKIQTVWGLVERSASIITRRYFDQESIHFNKGDELGRFLLGSSIILLLPRDKIHWLSHLKEQSSVKMGEKIGDIS